MQLFKIVSVTVENELLVRKVVLFDLFRDTGLQRTFHCVPKHVVRCRKAAGVEEYLRVRNAKVGKSLEVLSIHIAPSLVHSSASIQPAAEKPAKENRHEDTPESYRERHRDGTETSGSRSPEEFAAFLAENGKLWERMVRDSGAKLD